MKLSELGPIQPITRAEFSQNPPKRYPINKSSSVKFVGGETPKDNEQGTWKFTDGDFEQTITGSFKPSVTKAIASHKHLKGSSFSHTLSVKKI
jgi:hypothetical protein